MSQFCTMISLAIALVFIQGLAALNVTSPNSGSTWNLKDAITVTWSAVSTDPTTFNIQLVNQDPSCAPTGMSRVIKENVPCKDGTIQISGMHEVKECGGYQINLVSSSNNGILAQSAPFKISGSATGQADSSQPEVNSSGVNGQTNSPQPGAVSSSITQSGDHMSTPSQGAIATQNSNFPHNLPSQPSSNNETSSQSSASVTTFSTQTLITLAPATVVLLMMFS